MSSRRSSPDRSELRQRLRRHVDVLADLIGPRHLDLADSFDRAAEYVEHELAHVGPVKRQEYDVQGRPVANLVLERPGHSRPEEIVVVGAHYDTVMDTPGADDNASAVAVLLEVARMLKDLRPARTDCAAWGS